MAAGDERRTPEPSERDTRTALGMLADLYERVDQKLDQAIEGLAEVKAEQRAQGITQQRTLDETRKTNGRVSTLEGRYVDLEGELRAHVQAHERRDAFRDGEEAVRRRWWNRLGTVWEWAQKPLAWGLGSAIFLIVLALAGAVFERFQVWR